MTNRPAAFIECNDRRLFVCRWHLGIHTPEDRHQYFNTFKRWFKSGGYKAIDGHLATKEISSDLHYAARMTPDKEQALAFQTAPATMKIMPIIKDFNM